jgi:hypothetical protein
MQESRFWPSISCTFLYQMKQINTLCCRIAQEDFKEPKLIFKVQVVYVLWAFEDLSFFTWCLLYFGDCGHNMQPNWYQPEFPTITCKIGPYPTSNSQNCAYNDWFWRHVYIVVKGDL